MDQRQGCKSDNKQAQGRNMNEYKRFPCPKGGYANIEVCGNCKYREGKNGECETYRENKEK